MPANLSTIKYGILAVLSSALLVAALPGHSANTGAQGIALYKQGRYADAARLLEGVCRNPATDADTLYYYALALHRIGSFDLAREAYFRVVRQYPLSPASKLAVKAIETVGLGGPSKNFTGSTSSGGNASFGVSTRDSSAGFDSRDSLPEQARVYFTPSQSEQIIVDVNVNNRPIKMLFDTGADTCCFGKNHLKELNIPAPTGRPTSQMQGVGDGGMIKTWDMPATVKLGNIEKKNMNITVQETLGGYPLLGQTFFRDFTYTVDKGTNSIQFNRKLARSGGSSGSSQDRNSLPFQKVGNSVLVTGYINGKPMRMIFDTGADNTVFAYGDMKTLGIGIPDDAQEVVHSGIAGDTHGVAFRVQRLTIGPIERNDFTISVIQGFEAGHPLIGRNFMGEWQYTIDNDAKVIHFLRR